MPIKNDMNDIYHHSKSNFKNPVAKNTRQQLEHFDQWQSWEHQKRKFSFGIHNHMLGIHGAEDSIDDIVDTIWLIDDALTQSGCIALERLRSCKADRCGQAVNEYIKDIRYFCQYGSLLKIASEIIAHDQNLCLAARIVKDIHDDLKQIEDLLNEYYAEDISREEARYMIKNINSQINDKFMKSLQLIDNYRFDNREEEKFKLALYKKFVSLSVDKKHMELFQ